MAVSAWLLGTRQEMVVWESAVCSSVTPASSKVRVIRLITPGRPRIRAPITDTLVQPWLIQ